MLRRRIRRLPIASELRIFRLTHGITLSDAAAEAGLSMTRASELERDPTKATADESEALRAAVLRLSESSTVAVGA